ncbi:MAG: homogentisate 1,2-dioxygenase [Myxococcales bacterium]|nr:homogentisate 1,2-dioxygenase [Myxococcales bacterium]
MTSPITHFGAHALTDALAWLREQGVWRPLLICGPSQRFADEVEAALGELPVRRFTEAEVHVPRAKVEAARAVLAEHEADAIVTVGGGSATGLGKALRLLPREGRARLPFVAIPTTYAGSEMTRIHGVTEGGHKQTGRDERARPDVVAYVPALLDTLPRRLTVQSLLNAMAHPVSALSTGELSPPLRAQALHVIERLYRAVLVLAERPRHREARVSAARGASDAARILDESSMGVHHTVAHVLGARFGLPHAALHAALLPATLAAIVRTDPELLAALPEADPLAALFDALAAVGGATSIAALGVEPAEALAAIEDATGPQPWVLPALLGRRPSRFVRWQGWNHGHPLSVRGDLARATDVVVAVHGRGASADAIVQRARELLGDAPGFAVVAPQAPGTTWSSATYLDARREDPQGVRRALETIAHARAWARERAPGARLHLLGFSQGACLALELLAESPEPFDTIIALAGARVGPVLGRPPIAAGVRGVPVLLGKSAGDRFIEPATFETTVAELEAAGAVVETIVDPGEAHEISGRQRIRARELLLRRSAHEGGHGFGNVHASEALPGALPRTQNSPRRAPYGLVPEQLSGTGFVAPRHANLRSWLYRLRPAAGHRPFMPLPHPTFTEDFADRPPAIDLVGHRPLTIPEAPTDFVDGMHTYGGQGRAARRRGFAIHLYAANRSMEHRAFYDADGDLLLLPQEGTLTLRTELGPLQVGPGQLAIVPRGIAFSVLLHEPHARGYVGEVFGRHFELPERGVVGANGLADARHFRAPAAWLEERPDPGFRLTAKLGGRLHQALLERSPFDVAAWHGNYLPYVYDLAMFSPVANVAFDHADPSVYLVLTAPLDERGADSLDLVVFPPRWDPTAHTFRPPFFHRNAVTEFNGIVRDHPSEGSPFTPGGSFLTPAMTAHGVLDRAVERALERSDEQADRPSPPSSGSLWFQLETALPLSLSEWAAQGDHRIEDWPDAWGRYRSWYVPPGADKL